jgi:anion-transporting  ArsA/GET3 family ATPase
VKKKTIQDVEVEMESLKKIQTEVKQKMKNLENQAKTSVQVFSTECKRISGIEDKLGELNASVE